jgi:hypothetical protein
MSHRTLWYKSPENRQMTQDSFLANSLTQATLSEKVINWLTLLVRPAFSQTHGATIVPWTRCSQSLTWLCFPWCIWLLSPGLSFHGHKMVVSGPGITFFVSGLGGEERVLSQQWSQRPEPGSLIWVEFNVIVIPTLETRRPISDTLVRFFVLFLTVLGF